MLKIVQIIVLVLISFYSEAELEFDREEYYETPEFQSSTNENHMGMVYICIELSIENNYESDSEDLLEKFRLAAMITPEHSAQIRRDAKRWWARKPQGKDYRFFWDKLCKEPMQNMRNFFNSD